MILEIIIESMHIVHSLYPLPYFFCSSQRTKQSIGIRDTYTQYFVNHPVKIGGPGIEVEIDESNLAIENTMKREVDIG